MDRRTLLVAALLAAIALPAPVAAQDAPPAAEAGAEPSPAPAETATPAPVKPAKPVRIAPLAVPAAQAKKFKVAPKDVAQLNFGLKALNEAIAAGTAWDDVSVQLMVLTEYASRVGTDVPAVREKMKGVFALYHKVIFDRSLHEKEPFFYHGAAGALEMDVNGTDLYGLGLDAPLRHIVVRLTVKSHAREALTILQQGRFYLINTSGQQTKSIGGMDLVQGRVWDWLYDHDLNDDDYEPPERLLPGAKADFKVIFPEPPMGSLPQRLVYALDDYNLEIPIWHHM